MPGPLDSVSCDRLADTLHRLAGEVLDAEAKIKEELLAAVESGDCERAARILRAWIANPVAVEVAAGLQGG